MDYCGFREKKKTTERWFSFIKSESYLLDSTDRSNVVAVVLTVAAVAVLAATSETLNAGEGAISLSRGPEVATNERIGCSKWHC